MASNQHEEIYKMMHHLKALNVKEKVNTKAPRMKVLGGNVRKYTIKPPGKLSDLLSRWLITFSLAYVRVFSFLQRKCHPLKRCIKKIC